MRRPMAALVATLSITLAACGGSDPATSDLDDPSEASAVEAEDLTIVFPAPSAMYWNVYAAMDQGYFEEQGFKPGIVAAQGSAAALQQLASGGAQLSAGTPEAVISAVAAGADIKMISHGVTATVGTLIAADDIQSYSDLKGKTIGVSALKGGEITWIRQLLEQNGVAEDDVTYIVAGTAGARIAAIEADQVAAAIVFPPTDYAQIDKGFTRLGSILDVDLTRKIPFVGLNVQSEWAQENDRVERLRRVFEKANDWLNDPANHDDAVRILAEATQQDAKYVEETYDAWFVDEQLWTDGSGPVSAEQIELATEIMIDNGLLDAAAAPTPEELIIP